MQGENEAGDRTTGNDHGGSIPRCTSSADGMPGCSTVLIDSPIKSTASACRSTAAPLVGARSGDGKTRRYVRSSEPRLKWTEDLHQCFLRATAKLGGPEKATPKAIWQEMNVRWLKIAHIKSHLQMYRSPKSRKSNSPRSDIIVGESSELWSSHAMDKEYQAVSTLDAAMDQTSGYRHKYIVQESADSELEEAGSWISRGSGIQHPELTNVDLFTTATTTMTSRVDHAYLQDQPFHNVLISQSTSDHGDESRVGAELFNLTEVLLESHSDKSREFETTSDDVGIDRRLYSFLSDQFRLAGDADATEALAHNLLMAMRERKLLEARVSPQADVGATPEVPLELTMSVGSTSTPPNPNLRAEILTLDLTEQLNRPHL